MAGTDAEDFDAEVHAPSDGPSIVSDRLYCFIDDARLCGPGCMAYVSHPKPAHNELADGSKHCALISAAERVGRNAVVAAGALTRFVKLVENKTSQVSQMATQGLNPFRGT